MRPTPAFSRFPPIRTAALVGGSVGLTDSGYDRYLRKADMRRELLNVADRRQAEWGRAWRLRRNAFLIGLGLGGLLYRLDLLFHWLEGGSEDGGGQLGNVPAIADSGFNPFLDQPLLQSMNSAGLFTAASACIAAVKFLAFLVANS